MDKKPLIAEPSLILLDDCSHSIEKVPNLPILLFNILTSQTSNMDANSTDEPNNTQDTSQTKGLSPKLAETANSSSDVKPQEEGANDRNTSSFEPTVTNTALSNEPKIHDGKEVKASNISTKSPSPTSSQEVAAAASLDQKSTAENHSSIHDPTVSESADHPQSGAMSGESSPQATDTKSSDDQESVSTKESPSIDTPAVSASANGEITKNPPLYEDGKKSPTLADSTDKMTVPPTTGQSGQEITTPQPPPGDSAPQTHTTTNHTPTMSDEPVVISVPEVILRTTASRSPLFPTASITSLPLVSSRSSSVISSTVTSVALSTNVSLISSANSAPNNTPVISTANDSLTSTSHQNSSSNNSVLSLASLATKSLLSHTSASVSPAVPSTQSTHIPVVKGAFQKVSTHPSYQDPIVTLISQGAEKLTATKAEVLQGPTNLLSQQKQIEMKSREEVSGKAPPQVAVIPPIIDLSKSHDLSHLMASQQGQGLLKKGGVSGQEISGTRVTTVEKTVAVPPAHMTHREPRNEGKSPHPVARRIWMSSCRPLDPASLERIGVDSKGNVYWYDGGKNMFLSPASTDPAYKPSESELQLVCKSMVQWTAKLKELRMSSDQQADIKLAQTIKDQFMSRVRVATQRKPRDVSVLQNLQAVHTGSAIKQTQISKQHIVAMATTDASKSPQFVQSAFPQGSILVVPHGGSPFHHTTVLPIFGGSAAAMIMPQPITGVTTVASKDGAAVTLPSTSSVGSKVMAAAAPSIVIQSGGGEPAGAGTSDKKAKGEKEEPPKPAAVVLTTDQAKSLFAKQSALNMPVIVPPSLAGGVLPAMIQNYQQALAFYPPVYTMKVSEPVKMEDVNFNCKAIEISGEVPIRKIPIEENKESEDIEVMDSSGEQSKQTAVTESKGGGDTTPTPFAGHSSAEVMSAKLLLSLTGRSDNWPQVTPDSKVPIEQKVAMSSPLTREEAMSISTPVSTNWSAAPSSGRKRKQTPIASAKPSVSDDAPSSTGSAKVRRVRKTKADDDKVTPKRRAAPKKNAKTSDTAPPSQPLLKDTPVLPKADDITMETSQASASMQQLKASRASKPMKEFVIETDSDSDSSSSGSSSSHANSESSSESSSDSSSEEEVTQQKSVVSRGRGRGRGRGGKGRGGTTSRAQTKGTFSSDESGDLKKTPKTQSRRGGRGSAQSGRGKGGAQRRPAQKSQEHIVSIPTEILNNKQPVPSGKKRKSQDGESEKPADGSKWSNEYTANTPTDLASLYAKKGGVDLSILSELTQSVGASGDMYPIRTKRTCVRVREQITKLQEILGDEAETKSPGSTGSKVKGRGTGRTPTSRSSDTGQQESSVSGVVSGVGVSPKKYKRSTYSQFTHKRRKRKKKSPEEEALWQPAQQSSGEKKIPVYVFSSSWANKAAAAVEKGIFDNIIKFHKAQKGPGYHILDKPSKPRKPSSPPPKEPSMEREDEEEAESEEEKAPPKRGQRGKAKPTPPKKSPATRGGRRSSVRKSPPIPRAFLRSSSRLRKQRNEPDPEDYHSSPDESSPHHTPSPSPLAPPPPAKRTRASMGGRVNTRSTRSSRRKQKSPESFVQDDSESDTQSPAAKDNASADSDKHKSEDEMPNKKARLSQELDGSLVGSSPDNPSKSESSAAKKDDINYTICHGTPGDKTADDSEEYDSYSRPKGPLLVSSLATTTPSETVLSPEMSSRVSTPRAQPAPGTPEQSKGTPTETAQTPRETPGWNPNLHHHHQFAGVPPGYPSVYNPALHGMGYPAPPAPGIHGSNYPYHMPYPWPHGAHSQISTSQDPSRHSTHTGEGQQFIRGGEANSSPALVAPGTHISTAGTALQQQHRQQPQSTTRPAYTPDGQGIQKAPGLENPALSHAPSLHPLTSPVSGSSPLAHQATHGFTQSSTSLNPPDFHLHGHNHPAHPPHFPYGFEHSAASLQQMHLWHSQQPHLSQIAGIRSSHIPAHMSAHGLWYPPTQPMPHFMQAGEIPAHYRKPAGKTAKPLPADKAGANRNANNNNNNNSNAKNDGKFLNIGPHLAKYQAKAFPEAGGSQVNSNSSRDSMNLPQRGASDVERQGGHSGSYSVLNKPY